MLKPDGSAGRGTYLGDLISVFWTHIMDSCKLSSDCWKYSMACEHTETFMHNKGKSAMKISLWSPSESRRNCRKLLPQSAYNHQEKLDAKYIALSVPSWQFLLNMQLFQNKKSFLFMGFWDFISSGFSQISFNWYTISTSHCDIFMHRYECTSLRLAPHPSHNPSFHCFLLVLFSQRVNFFKMVCIW